jgi:pseudouridine kinase|tara:strand:- start:3806 stop:4909 length:1104 start_codon:yes stop_codon:yes gene_type:complete
MNITNREQEILAEIEANPQISQRDLSKKLGITRSAVAVHIMNLNVKGLIKGRGYILGKQPFITLIGGANIDIHGTSIDRIKPRDSNPGNLFSSPGGVARNIAENITRLGFSCRLITAVGQDQHGDFLIRHCQKIGIDTRYILRHEEMQTSSYLSIIDSSGEMLNAISDMKVISAITPSYIKSIRKILDHSEVLILDTNIAEDTLKYVVEKFNQIPIFVDTVSTTKAKKILPYLSQIHTLKPNLMEAEAISGIKIKDHTKLPLIANWFHNKGLKRLFITLGEKGIFYSDTKESGIVKPPRTKKKIVNVSGAGDASMAGLIYAWKAEYNLKDSAKKALIAAQITLVNSATINPSMSTEYLENKYDDQYA